MIKHTAKRRQYIFFLMPALFILLLWFVFGIEQLFDLDLAKFSIQPRTNRGLLGVLVFPLLHGSLSHLAGNTSSLFILLVAVRYVFPQLYTRVFWLAYFVPGIITWVIGRPAFHLGASGMIYMLVVFVFISGVIRANRYLLALSLLTVFLYGSMIWGIFPIEEGISWEGHLAGAFTGFAVAIWYRKELPADAVKEKEPDWSDDDDYYEWYMDVDLPEETKMYDQKQIEITYHYKPKEKEDDENKL